MQNSQEIVSFAFVLSYIKGFSAYRWTIFAYLHSLLTFALQTKGLAVQKLTQHNGISLAEYYIYVSSAYCDFALLNDTRRKIRTDSVKRRLDNTEWLSEKTEKVGNFCNFIR